MFYNMISIMLTKVENNFRLLTSLLKSLTWKYKLLIYFILSGVYNKIIAASLDNTTQEKPVPSVSFVELKLSFLSQAIINCVDKKIWSLLDVHLHVLVRHIS